MSAFRKEHFRGVVWSREPVGGCYRYAVCGVLVSDRPIPDLEKLHHRTVLDGPCELAEGLSVITRKTSTLNLGDANAVLLSLGRMEFEGEVSE